MTAADDDFLDKAVEGFVMFALNQGEVCTCPSRALIHSSIYDEFMARCLERTKAIKGGNPLDPTTMIGAQASNDQFEKILSYIDIGKKEGAELLTGGGRRTVPGLEGGYYIEPTVFKGTNDMRIFQEEIFGPVVSVTTFDSAEEALKIANDTLYGLGAGVWTRDGNTAYRLGREIKAGRVWTNCYHAYPAHAAFGGYKRSGIGRENPQDDARPLPADEEPPGQLLAQEARVLLMDARDQASGADVGRRGPGAATGRPARAGDVPPVRRLLRRQCSDVLPARRVPGRRRGCPARPASPVTPRSG